MQPPKEYAFGWSKTDRPAYDYNHMPIQWMSSNEYPFNKKPSEVIIHTKGDVNVVKRLSDDLNRIDEISITHGGSAYIEVKPHKINKASALKYITSNLLDIKRNEVLAMGDNDNDAEMLSWAGIGVAVESASEIAKVNSDYIASYGVIQGAIEVLQTVREAKRLFISN